MAATEREHGSCCVENGKACCTGLKTARSLLIAFLVVAAIALAIYFVAPILAVTTVDNGQTLTKEKGKTVPVTVTDANFEAEVLKSEQTVLVDFWATWCGPCKKMEPIVEAIAKEYAGRLKVVKVRIEDAPKAVAKYKVESIPTFLVIRRGEVKIQLVGAVPKEALVKVVEPYLN